MIPASGVGLPDGSLLDLLPCGFARVAGTGEVLWVNGVLLSMLGYGSDELVGRHFNTVLAPGTRIFLQTHLLPTVRLHGSAEEVFLILRTRDGRDLDVLTHAVRRSDADAGVVDYAFMRVRERHRYEAELKSARQAAEEARVELEVQAEALVDANHRLEEQATEMEEMLDALQEASEAARASEARFRAALDAMPGGIAIVDARNGALLMFNDTACSLLGYTREEFARMRMGDVDPRWSPGRIDALVRRLAGSPAGLQLRSRFRTRDDEVRDVLVSLRALEGGDQVYAVWVDVTGQMRAEAEARAQRELLDTVLGNIPLLVGLVDRGGQLLWANQRWHRLLGWPSAPGRAPAAGNGGAGWHRERMTAADGTPVETAWTTVRLTDGRTIAIGQDVTAEVAAEAERAGLEEQLRQAQKMEAVGRLAGGVAHDFNNLLMVIRGFAMLLDGAAPEAPVERAYLSEIQRAAERATSLTQQLLAFGRKQALQPRVLDLAQVVEGAGAMLRRLVREDVEITSRTAPRPWATRADPHQVEQVLMNLVVNARDAIRGRGTVEIAVENRTVAATLPGVPDAVPPGRYVTLAVTDDGCGMEPATLAQVFEPFFTTKGVGHGTGLGLSTVYGIVRQSDGYVACRSAPGEGSRFTVFLPALVPGVDAGADAPSDDAVPRGSATVLLVEDDAAVRGLIRLVLSDAGYTVLEAQDGEGALRVAAAHPGRIDLLLTDTVMPRMGGPELVRTLRGVRPEVRALLMSGYAGDALGDDGIPAGVGFLQKPIDPAALLRQVHDLAAGG